MAMVHIGQNTKKSPGDLRRLAVIQPPVKDNKQTQAKKKTQKKKFFRPLSSF